MWKVAIVVLAVAGTNVSAQPAPAPTQAPACAVVRFYGEPSLLAGGARAISTPVVGHVQPDGTFKPLAPYWSNNYGLAVHRVALGAIVRDCGEGLTLRVAATASYARVWERPTFVTYGTDVEAFQQPSESQVAFGAELELASERIDERLGLRLGLETNVGRCCFSQTSLGARYRTDAIWFGIDATLSNDVCSGCTRTTSVGLLAGVGVTEGQAGSPRWSR